MSKTIDERVVEMRFDNDQFERNVSTSMSTLDKLRQSLHLTGATKGLENVDTAAKKVDLSGISNAAETVGIKFNAMYTIADQALRNLTNSAMNYGKRITSALTIDPIKTGFSEYETQINAVQTILANTQSKGTTLDDVNKALDTLNTYADKTIYNFTEMTRNIGTFTAAGIDLDTSVNAIQGIANLAAVSGSNSQQASTAMYQLSQALSSGTVKLMDWNSVVNAGMGGQVFQDALKETARAHGVAIDSMIKENGSFRDSLQEGWLTSEILTETLQKFTLTTEGLTDDQIEANREMLRSKGYTEDQIDEIFKLGETATNAATKVKTFTQLWDVLKEAAQSGWTQTWELIIGDFEQAKNLLTPLSDFFTGVINGMSEARNKLIGGAMSSPLGDLSNFADKIKSITGVTDEMSDALDTINNRLEDLDEIVNRVIRGEFGNVDTGRIERLAEAGYDYATVQNAVNKRLGSSVRIATDASNAQSDLADAESGTAKARANNVEQLLEMTDGQLMSLGLTKKEIKSLRDLEEACDKAGISVGDFIEDTSLLDGRTLLLNSFKNAGKGLVKTLGAIRDAWREVFPPMTSEQLYGAIAGLHKFSLKLAMSDETADKLKRTLKGVFAILDIALTLTAGPIKIAFKVLREVLKLFDMDILDLTASIGDAIVGFRDWIDSAVDFGKYIKQVPGFIKKVKNAIGDWIDELKESDNIPRDIIIGLVNGLKSGVGTVVEAVLNLGRKILDTIKDVLGIHSPSREFLEIGNNVILGFVEGIQNGASFVWEVIKNVALKCVDVVRKIDLGALLAAVIGIGMITAITKVADTMKMFAAPLEGIGDMLEGIGDMFTGLSKNFKAAAMKKRSEALLNMAKAIGILVIAVYALTKIKPGTLWASIGALAALAGIMVGLAVASEKLNSVGEFGLNAVSILAIAGSLLLLSLALKQLSKIDGDDVTTTIGLFATAILGLAGIMLVFGKFVKADSSGNLDKAGVMILKMSTALLLMTFVIKRIAKMSNSDIHKGLGVVIALESLFMAVIAVSKLAGEHASKAGSMLLKMSVAFLVMIVVIKQAAKMDSDDVWKGIGAVAALEILFGAIIAISKLAGPNASKAGMMMLLMSVALSLAVGVIKQASKLESDEIWKGIGVIAALELLFAAIIKVSKGAGKNITKVGRMLLMMSTSLLLLSGVMFILSELDPAGLGRALGAIILLEACFAGIIAVTKIAKGTKGMSSTLMMMVIAIGLLSVAVIGLSFIEPGKLATATAAISTLIGVFALMIKATQYAKTAKGMRKSLTQMLGVIVVLGLVVAALSFIPDPGTALKSAVALSMLMITLSAAFAIMGKSGKISKTVTDQLTTMLVVVGGLAAILALMSLLPNPNAAIVAAGAITVLLEAFSVSLVILSKAGKMSKTVTDQLDNMMLVVGGLAIILGLLSLLPVQPSIQTATALSILLEALAGAMLILSYTNGATKVSLEALASMELAIAGLAVILGVMAGLGIEASIQTATALSILLLSMSGAFAVIAAVGKVCPDAMDGVLAFDALIASIAVVLGVLGGLQALFPELQGFIETGIPMLEAIGEGLGSFFGGAIAGLIDTVGDTLPKLGENIAGFVDNVVDVGESAKDINPQAMEGLKTLADALLSITAGELLDALAGLIGDSSMEDFGTQLESFGTALVKFSDTVADNIDNEAVESAANAGKMMAAMADTIPNSGGVVGFFTGENDLDTFAEKLVPFGEAIVEFSNVVKEGIDEDAIEAAANAGKMMSAMADTIPNSGGVVGFFAGENDLDTFAEKLVPFGEAIVEFSSTVAGNVNVDGIEAAANAGKIMTAMADTVPNSGGVVGFFTGENDIDAFGTKLVTFGEGIKSFSDTITKDGGIDAGAVEAAAQAGTLMSTLASTLPKEGGVTSWFGGDEKSLTTFGFELLTFGGYIKGFSDAVTGIDPTSTTAAIDVANNISTAATSCKSAFDTIGEGVSLDMFGLVITGFGDMLSGYSESVADVDLTAVSNAASSASIMRSTITTLSNVTEICEMTGSEFEAQVVPFGRAIYSYSKSVEGVDATSATNAATLASKLVDMINSTAGIDTSGVSPFVAALNQLASTSVNEFVSTFTGSIGDLTTAGENMIGAIVTGITSNQPTLTETTSTMVNGIIDAIEEKYDTFNQSGINLSNGLIEGINKQKSAVKGAVTASVSNAASGADDYYDDFYSAGSYMVTGFANGISENDYKAAAKASAMAKAAKEAAEEALGINSPSRVFYQIGGYTGQGFINALADYGKRSYNAGSELANSARTGLSNAIAKIRTAIDSDMDMQPTIRPVLDLSDIESGAGAIGGLFSGGASVGVLANVDSISSMMSSHNQNGTDDVVSAINKLRKDIGNISSPSYTINGVTYDDGSNISDTIKSLVRYAKIERRV